MAEKINGNMGMKEVLLVMSEGNPGALMVLMGMIESPAGFIDILTLDSIDIRGWRLYVLNNDCCERNPEKFARTLTMFRSGVFTQEEIHHNLENQSYALPFIDDSIEMDGIPPYGEDFGPNHPKWNEWCKAQKESYKHRNAA